MSIYQILYCCATLESKYILFLTDSMLHNVYMQKKKVQVIIYRVLENNEKEFLLLKTNKRRGSFWQSVTGGVENGEDFLSAAIRETEEETNCQQNQIIKLIDLEMDFEFHDQWGNDVHEKVYSLQAIKDFDLKIDPSEHDVYQWVKANDINNSSVKYETNYKAIKKCIES